MTTSDRAPSKNRELYFKSKRGRTDARTEPRCSIAKAFLFFFHLFFTPGPLTTGLYQFKCLSAYEREFRFARSFQRTDINISTCLIARGVPFIESKEIERRKGPRPEATNVERRSGARSFRGLSLNGCHDAFEFALYTHDARTPVTTSQRSTIYDGRALRSTSFSTLPSYRSGKGHARGSGERERRMYRNKFLCGSSFSALFEAATPTPGCTPHYRSTLIYTFTTTPPPPPWGIVYDTIRLIISCLYATIDRTANCTRHSDSKTVAPRALLQPFRIEFVFSLPFRFPFFLLSVFFSFLFFHASSLSP